MLRRSVTAQYQGTVGPVGVTSMVPGGVFFLQIAAPMTPPIVEKTAPAHSEIMNPTKRRKTKMAAVGRSRLERSSKSRNSGGRFGIISTNRRASSRSVGPTSAEIGIEMIV